MKKPYIFFIYLILFIFIVSKDECDIEDNKKIDCYPVNGNSPFTEENCVERGCC